MTLYIYTRLQRIQVIPALSGEALRISRRIMALCSIQVTHATAAFQYDLASRECTHFS